VIDKTKAPFEQDVWTIKIKSEEVKFKTTKIAVK